MQACLDAHFAYVLLWYTVKGHQPNFSNEKKKEIKSFQGPESLLFQTGDGSLTKHSVQKE